MTFKYFKNDGTEQMASILINDKPLNHFMYEENRKAVNNG
jgi:hypothetical protein